MFSAKKLFCFLIPILLLINSCDKNRVDTRPGPVPETWGRLTAVKEETKRLIGTDWDTLIAEVAVAHFVNPVFPTVLLDAGEVRLNSFGLIRNGQNEYFIRIDKDSTPSGLNLSSVIDWQVSGNGLIPAAAFSDTAIFPLYDGMLPLMVSKTNGISFVFDSTTVTDADSVRVYIYDGQGNSVLRSYYAKAGTVTVTPAALASLSIVTNNTAYIGIMPYAGTLKLFKNKGFYFARERRYLQSININ